MNRKTVIIFMAIVGVIVSVSLFFRDGREEISLHGSDSTGLVISTSAIYVAEQAPSQTVAVTLIRLEKSGFVVIHEDVADVPGKILGISKLLPTGETNNLKPILLSRPTRDGETLYAMIHLDDGDSIFDEVKDRPALDPISGLPMMMIFSVSTEATEPGAVSL